MTDPIADLLTRIRNGQRAQHESVSIPYSKLKQGIIKALYEEGFIGPFRVLEEGGGKAIQVTLRYSAKREPVIIGLKRESRPGRRYYLGFEDLKPIRNVLGISILSTSKGILTDRQAREEKVGGELLCRVW